MAIALYKSFLHKRTLLIPGLLYHRSTEYIPNLLHDLMDWWLCLHKQQFVSNFTGAPLIYSVMNG